MSRNEGYREALAKIEEAWQKGAKSLSLHGMGLTELPESLSQFTLLQTLDLSDNRLRVLPKSLGQLSQLQKLVLSGNQLTALPESLGQLSQLQDLYLWGNQLTSLPESAGQLSQLQELSLSRNQLTALPESLGQLSQLQELVLSLNQLTALPESLGQLSQLQKLVLSGNQLTALPKSLGQLSQLQKLDLSHNQLTALPEWLGQLSRLQALYLFSNQLTALPESIGNLTSLKKIDISGNQLVWLPDSFVRLTALKSLNLGDKQSGSNPLNPELAAAYEQGRRAVMDYLRAKAEAEIVLNEAKLILIGEGEVGKSSLLGALRGDEWVEDRETTHGVDVDIKSLVLADPDSGDEITLNGWDFGGQNIYRHTHQLFFTAPAVYLAVWNPRRGPEQCCVDEWIKMVKHRAHDDDRPDDRPRILVVATHGGPEERSAHIDERALRDEFGHLIVGFHHVDSKTGHGLDELKRAIGRTAADIPSVGRSVALSWKNVLDALRKRSKKAPYITYGQFESICHRHKVGDELARTYAAILNELGHLIHYRGDADFQGTVILKPEWLSKAMSFVLDDDQVKLANGLVEHDRLSKIWNDPDRHKTARYPSELHPVFLKLMERFDLTYRVAMPEAGAAETSLVAQLVPGGRPNGWEQDWTPEPASGDTERTQVCRIVDAETGRTAQVEGLFYRLIVRLHRYSLGRKNYYDSRHWKTGMILDDGPNGRAFIEEIAGDVRVTVRAAYPERFLHLLCEEVRWLVDHFWKGLDCQLSVPCHPPCKGLFEVAELIETKWRGIPELRCSVCKTFQEIDSLVATVAPKPEFSQAVAELKQGQAEIKHGMQVGFDSVHTELRRLISQADEQFAALMTALTDPAKEGPRLFSFDLVDPGFWDKPKWVAKKFRLTLWCEHSRLPLPLLTGDKKRGVYELEITRDWITKAAPFVKILSTTLSLALPIASSATKLAMDSLDYKAIEDQLNFGQKCAESFLKGGEKVGDWITSDDDSKLDPGRGIRAQGAMLRELHGLLRAKDPVNSFGGLVRVQNKQREFLWVHEQFRDKD